MNWTRRFCLGMVVLVVAATVQFSQLHGGEPRLRVVTIPADELLKDLKVLVESSPQPALKSQWKNLNEMLTSFLPGIDTAKPVRCDVVLSKTKTAAEIDYLPCFPIKKLKGVGGFLENLDSLGYTAKEKPPGTFTIDMGKKNPTRTMIYVDGHGCVGQTAAQWTEKTPGAGLMDALGKADVLVDYAAIAEDAKDREALVSAMRRELEAGIRQKTGEAAAEFELRKILAANQFDEFQRLVVETQKLKGTWTTEVNAAKPNEALGSGVLDLSGLPETSLEKLFAAQGMKPSYFGAIPMHASPVVSGKMNLVLDEQYKSHLKKSITAMKPALEKRIESFDKLDAAGKTAAKAASEKLFDMLLQSVAKVDADTFIDLHAASENRRTMIAGLRSADGSQAVAILQQLPAMRENCKVELNAAEIGDVKLHRVHIPGDAKEFESVFGKVDPVILVGTSPDAVWFAAGVNAQEELAAAIAVAGKATEADPAFLWGNVSVNVGTMLIDIVTGKYPPNREKMTRAQIRDLEQAERLLAIAKQCFAAGNDSIVYRLERKEKALHGELKLQPGIMTYIGAAIADFAKNNLN